jgi:hypothetical protein
MTVNNLLCVFQLWSHIRHKALLESLQEAGTHGLLERKEL